MFGEFCVLNEKFCYAVPIYFAILLLLLLFCFCCCFCCCSHFDAVASFVSAVVARTHKLHIKYNWRGAHAGSVCIYLGLYSKYVNIYCFIFKISLHKSFFIIFSHKVFYFQSRKFDDPNFLVNLIRWVRRIIPLQSTLFLEFITFRIFFYPSLYLPYRSYVRTQILSHRTSPTMQ